MRLRYGVPLDMVGFPVPSFWRMMINGVINYPVNFTWETPYAFTLSRVHPGPATTVKILYDGQEPNLRTLTGHRPAWFTWKTAAGP